MAEKKLQENSVPDDQKTEPGKCKDMGAKSSDKASSPTLPQTTSIPAQVSIPSFTKASPNDLYRRWLPAVLFLLTFVTVMTILLIYMDTVALGAQQFRLNMSRDYELSRISQESAALVAYVRQLHLAPRAPRDEPPPPPRPPRVDVLDRVLGALHNGTFVEWTEAGPRLPTALFLERARGWAGVLVRAAPTDYLALRGRVQTLHACLSPSTHPREVTYQAAGGAVFVSRVLCLPLYTVLRAAAATRAHYAVLAGPAVPAALAALPDLTLQVIEYQTTDMAARNQTTEFLLKHNYFIAANFTDGIMYALNQTITN